jgi:hypothetical protein
LVNDDVLLFRNQFFGDFGGVFHEFSGPLADLTNVFLGLRFATADGIHVGWIEVRQNFIYPQIGDSARQPLPNTPIQIGEKPNVPAVMGQPAPLVINTRTDGSRLVLGWNGFSPNCQLQSAPTPDFLTSTEVAGVRQNTISLPTEDTARYYQVIQLPDP